MSGFPNVRNEASSAVDRAHPLGQLRVPPHVTSFFCGLSLLLRGCRRRFVYQKIFKFATFFDCCNHPPWRFT